MDFGPLERQAMREKAAHERRLLDRLRIGERRRFLLDRRGGCGPRRDGRGRGSGQQTASWVGRAAGPVTVEVLRHVVDDLPDGENVEIDEEDVLAGAEVLVADVAPADHRRLVIRGERLVVHPPVEAREVEEVFEGAPPPNREWIEEPHLDVRSSVEGGERFVEAARVVVVQQQPHPDAAVGGAAQCVEKQGAGNIRVPDVVLDVEAALRGIGQADPRGEGVASAEQGNDTRQSRVRLRERRDRPTERTAAGILQPHRHAAVGERG
jgi:hypothetical protein